MREVDGIYAWVTLDEVGKERVIVANFLGSPYPLMTPDLKMAEQMESIVRESLFPNLKHSAKTARLVKYTTRFVLKEIGK